MYVCGKSACCNDDVPGWAYAERDMTPSESIMAMCVGLALRVNRRDDDDDGYDER